MEQGTVEKQQQDHVLTEDEAPPTLPDHWDVLETWRRSTTTININNLDLDLRSCHVLYLLSVLQFPACFLLSVLLLYCPTSDSNCWYHTALIHLITTNFTYIILLNITRYNNNCRSCALTYQEEHPCRDKHDDCCCTRIKLQFRRAEINQQSFITSVWVHQIMSRYIYNRRIHSHFT